MCFKFFFEITSDLNKYLDSSVGSGMFTDKDLF